MKINSREETVEKVQKAIQKLRKSDSKMSISKIAQAAGLERKTIYNNASLLEKCKQAIELQKLSLHLEEQENIHKKSVRQNTLEERYKKVKEELKQEREKNAKLLHNNKELVLENYNLQSRIIYFEEKNTTKSFKLK